MNLQLLTIQTSDGLSFQYPQKFLSDNCPYISDFLEEQMKGNLELPFTSEEMNAFLELLQTRRRLSSEAETLNALRVADYVRMDLTKAELNQIVADLSPAGREECLKEGIEQIDEFLKTRGYSELNMAALIDALENPDLLQSFVGPTREERYDRLLDFVKDAEEFTLHELIDACLKIFPYGIRSYLLIMFERYPSEVYDVKVEMNTTIFHAVLKICRKYYLKIYGEELPQGQPMIDPSDINELIRIWMIKDLPDPIEENTAFAPGIAARIRNYLSF